MKWKAVSRIALTLLCIGMLTVTFDIQAVSVSLPIHNLSAGEDFGTIQEAINHYDASDGRATVPKYSTLVEKTDISHEGTETVYIRANGTVEGTDKIQRDVDVYTFTDDINDSIVVERDDIVVNGAGYTLQGTGSEIGIYLFGRSNITIENMEIRLFSYCILLLGSSNNTVSRNNITNGVRGIILRESMSNIISWNDINEMSNGVGIGLDESSSNAISRNNINHNYGGIGLDESSSNAISRNNINHNTLGISLLRNSSSNTVFMNNVINNSYGVDLDKGSSNRIYHNNFLNNTYQTRITAFGYTNIWDDAYPSGGNYWSDYIGNDTYSGLYQNETGSDGLGDTPYVIDENNQDNYPLMKFWSPTGRILWDSSHGEEPLAHFSVFIDELQDERYQIDELTTGPITDSVLKGYDVLVIVSPTELFSTSEIDSIVSFVQEGHGLLQFCAFLFISRDVANPISTNFGVTFVTDMVKDPTNYTHNDPSLPIIHQMETHPITKDIDEFVIEESGTFELVLPAQKIAWGDKDAYSNMYPGGTYPPVLAVSELGNGRAVFIHDTDIFKDYEYQLINEYDNMELGLNIFDWLSTAMPKPVATLDIDPDTLNLKSNGRWITAYIELSEGFDVSDIDVSTIMLNYTIPAEKHPIGIGDEDADGVPDLMVKFDRQAMIEYLRTKGFSSTEITLAITGEVNDTPFECSDEISVLDK